MVRIAFSVTQEEFVEAYWGSPLARLRATLMAISALAALVGMALSWVKPLDTVTFLLMQAIFATVLLLVLLMFPTPGRVYRRMRDNLQDQQWEFADESITSVGPGSQVTNHWDRYDVVLVTRLNYLLKSKPLYLYHILPKRAFDAAGLEEFRRLVRAHLPRSRV